VTKVQVETLGLDLRAGGVAKLAVHSAKLRCPTTTAVQLQWHKMAQVFGQNIILLEARFNFVKV
jgi:hypothetical protein